MTKLLQFVLEKSASFIERLDEVILLKKGLVLIDIQRGFISDNTERVVGRIPNLFEKYKFSCVMATQFKNVSNSPYERFLNWEGLKNEDSQEIVPEIRRYADKIFVKYGYSCFTNEFEQFVEQEKFDRLYFAGIDPDCCVLKSALDCFERGIDLRVLYDCCASNGGKSSEEAAKNIMMRSIGKNQIIV